MTCLLFRLHSNRSYCTLRGIQTLSAIISTVWPNQISRAIWIITYHDYLYCTAEGNMVTLFYRRRSQMNFDRNGGKIGSLKWSINVWIVENVPK